MSAAAGCWDVRSWFSGGCVTVQLHCCTADEKGFLSAELYFPPVCMEIRQSRVNWWWQFSQCHPGARKFCVRPL